MKKGTSCFESGSLWRECSTCLGEVGSCMDPPSGAVHARLLFAFRGGSEARAAASAETASKSFAYPLHVRLICLDIIAAAHVQLTALSTYQQRDAVPPLVTTNLLPSDTRTTSRRAAEEIIAKSCTRPLYLLLCQAIMMSRYASSLERKEVRNSRLPPRHRISIELGKPQCRLLRTFVTSCSG